MAQATYSIYTSQYKGRSLSIRCSVKNSDVVSNCTEISWTLAGSGESGYVTCGNFKVAIDGKTVYASTDRRNVYNYTVIASGTEKIYHDEDGTRTVDISIEAGVYEVKVNRSASGTWELPPLARYSNITSFSVAQRDETSVTYTFSVDGTTDYAWYSADNGATWHDLPTTNIVSGLSANTTYQFKLRVRRKESQLTTDSATYPQSTYDYPHCTDAPNFTIGDKLTLTFYNPLSRNISVVGYADSDGSQIFAGTTTGTSLTGFNVNDENGGADAQYESLLHVTSGTYKVVVSYGTHSNTIYGGVYSIRGDEVPTLGSLSYKDGNNSIVAITGNNQQIVQNKSHLYVTFDDATVCNGTSIYHYVIECNGAEMDIPEYGGTYDFGTVNSSRNVELKLTAYDRRGLSASKSITVQMLAYEPPKATVELYRLNNYEDETYLTVDGSVSSVDGKNTMAIKYRYRQSGLSDPWGSYTTITDRTKQTLSLNKNNSYTFNIVVTDAFGEKFDKDYVLNKGVFPLFIDTEKNSVGVNCFPANENSLEVNGYDVLKTSMIHQGTANTDANNVTSNGIWLVKEGTVTNYPVQSGNGILIVFATTIGIHYQIFIRFNGVSWSRMCWYGNWQNWMQITSQE